MTMPAADPRMAQTEQAGPGRQAAPPPDFGFRNRGLLSSWLMVVLGVTAAIIAIGVLSPPVRVDNLLYDFVLQLSRPRPDSRILIVAIDDSSLNRLGRWPWSRELHARLLDQLTPAQPAAVGYDVLFPEPQDAAADAELAAAIHRNGRVVLPQIVEIPGPDGRPAQWIPPVGPLASAAAAVGHVMTRPDRDGVVRGIDRLVDVRNAPYRHLAENAVAIANGKLPAGADSPQRHSDAVYARGRDLMVFAGPTGSYPQVSFADVLAGQVPDDLIAGRIVLVGATAAGLGDRFSTPMSATLSTMPGIELQANYIDNLLNARSVQPASPVLWLGFSLLPVWGLMLSLFFLGPRINLWLGVLLVLAVLGATAISFVAFHLWLPPAMALIAIGIIYPLWGWRRLALASRYMVAELHALRSEGQVFRPHRAEVAGDPVARQITLMHEAISDVRDLRRFVTQSLESLPDAAVVADLDGRVVIANGAAGQLFRRWLPGPLPGQQLEVLLQRLDSNADVSDSHGSGLLSELRTTRLAAGDLPGASYELQLVDGTSLDVRIVFFTDSDWHPLGWIARFADITWLRAAEREREDTLRLLTHDMRAPQASILAVLDAEANRMPAETTQRLQRYARQTLTLADDFVHLARAKSSNYAQEPVNLADCVLDAADDLWPLAQGRNTRILVDVPAEEVLVTGDRALLTRSVVNILNNAIKYSGNDTVVNARVWTSGTDASCEIADTGRGIAPADLPRIFEVFSRGAPVESGPGSVAGTGLGLAFVKTVIERHRGRIDVRSEPGAGAVFTFVLPLAAEH